MSKNYLVKASRKKATARCLVKAGAGNILINKTPLEVLYSGYKQNIVREPANVVNDEFSKLDFHINVNGGGVMGQVQAARSCIAKGILAANNNKDKLREKLIKYDRHLLVDDVRQKETVKQLGKGARSRKQQSKR